MKRTLIVLYILVISQIVFGQRWAYVLNGNSETLSRVNLETGAVVNHIVNTGPVPNQVVYYDNLLYVVNSGSASLQIINPAANQTVGEIQLPINSNPLNINFGGDYAYVSGFLTASVYKIDLASRAVVDTIAVGQSPAALAVVDGILYVGNTAFNPANFSYGQGSVSAISLANGQELARINVGKNPQGIIEGPDGLINIICTGNYSTVSGSVHFINPIGFTVIDTINIGGEPFWPVLDQSGRCYVSAGGWSNFGVVFCYDAITRQIIKGLDNSIHVPIGAMGLAIDSAGILYCTAQQANVLSKFNSQGEIMATFPIGSGPSSVTIIDQRVGIEDVGSAAPVEYGLGNPYPNPFNSQVVIPIIGHSEERASQLLKIYDICGKVVRSLEIGEAGLNRNQIIWNGDDWRGNSASSGVYFARIVGTAGAVRLVLLR
jgi:DNA-binding beta-propeller fold protein YncE